MIYLFLNFCGPIRKVDVVTVNIMLKDKID